MPTAHHDFTSKKVMQIALSGPWLVSPHQFERHLAEEDIKLSNMTDCMTTPHRHDKKSHRHELDTSEFFMLRDSTRFRQDRLGTTLKGVHVSFFLST